MISIQRFKSRFTPLLLCLLGVSIVSPARAQQTPPPVAPIAPATPATGEASKDSPDKSKEADKDKSLTANEVLKESMKGNGGYVLGILPNYRTTNVDQPVVPLKPKEKMLIAFKDSFAPTIFVVTGVLAGLGQLENLHPQFGQGMEGYAKRYGTGYADQAIGNMMTEGIFPSILRQDPRYFRLGTGSAMSRTGWAVKQIFITRTDSGRHVFNASELVGNAVGATISMSYYGDYRTGHQLFQQWYTAVLTDMASDVLKEFWPDLKRKITKPKPEPNLAGPTPPNPSP
jgi:hypothetical protein